MKKIRVGIVGYGNLGKAIEKKIVLDDRFKPVVIFSRRNIKAKFLKTDNITNMAKYKSKIDIVFICVGSLKGLEDITYSCLKYFNTIDAFDTHKKINGYIKRCGELAKQYNHTAYCSIGWDPGLFSIMRVIFTSIGEEVHTIWGKGVSQGHSEAIRRIKYVEDAIQYTVPDKDYIKKLKEGEKLDKHKLHTRLCYVVSKKGKEAYIKEKIINMPNYFKGYKTEVNFVSACELKKHKKLFHKGEVFTVGGELAFKLNTKSNPNMTASIMIGYSYSLYNYNKYGKFGAYSVLDIPLNSLIKNADKLI